MKSFSFYLCTCQLLMIGLFSCADEDQQPDTTESPIQAKADIYTLAGDTQESIKIGEANITSRNGLVTLTLYVSGLAAGGQHAVHLHEGSCENPGSHWNGGSGDVYCEVPSQGKPWGKPYLGDIGNISIDEAGKGTLRIETELWGLGDGSPRDLAGTFLMLHAGPEDYTMACHQHTMPTNPKIACGAITLIR